MKCSHDQCRDVFQKYMEDHFDLEQTNLWNVRITGRTITRTRKWPNRPYFKPGDWVVSGCSLGGVTEIYEVLQRLGTPKRPQYDVRIIAASCPNNSYKEGAPRWHVKRVGTIEYAQQGNAFLQITPKHTIELFHCNDTHVPKENWPAYEAKEPEKKKRRTKKKKDSE